MENGESFFSEGIPEKALLQQHHFHQDYGFSQLLRTGPKLYSFSFRRTFDIHDCMVVITDLGKAQSSVREKMMKY